MIRRKAQPRGYKSMSRPQIFHPNSRCEEYKQDLLAFIVTRTVKKNSRSRSRQSSTLWEEARLLFPAIPPPPPRGLAEMLTYDSVPCKPIAKDLHLKSLERLKELRDIALTGPSAHNR
jgi:hypothetical protein